MCEGGTFLYIRHVSVGVSANYAVDAASGDISCPTGTCNQESLRYHEGTTYSEYNGLGVPEEMVRCGWVTILANFGRISYSCIDCKLFLENGNQSQSTAMRN